MDGGNIVIHSLDCHIALFILLLKEELLRDVDS